MKNSAQRFPKGRSIDREILNSENNQKLRSAIFGLFRSLRIALETQHNAFLRVAR
ncbi:hypothetical protein [Leptospira noguchii]|uniref:hypothetical protein n=1 Tax=Leptospira noguchii TaxID=28182 RepID=UPI001FB6E246|nr:hypothetical protein [Leptospira noguchii]UOG53065.1 hypothetical protein MAL09_02260 [Leptospira noguchii]